MSPTKMLGRYAHCSASCFFPITVSHSPYHFYISCLSLCGWAIVDVSVPIPGLLGCLSPFAITTLAAVNRRGGWGWLLQDSAFPSYLPLALRPPARRTTDPTDFVPRRPAGDLPLPGLLGNFPWVQSRVGDCATWSRLLKGRTKHVDWLPGQGLAVPVYPGLSQQWQWAPCSALSECHHGIVIFTQSRNSSVVLCPQGSG